MRYYEPSTPYSKVEVAAHQLQVALRLFLDDRDYISSITLAGASEEILGKLLEREGRKHSLGELIEACLAIGRETFKEEWPARHFADMANQFRNGLKHLGEEEFIEVPREAAEQMLDRAIDNYWAVTGIESPLIRRFMEEVHGI